MLKRLFPKKAPTSYDIAKIEYSGVFITSDQTEEIARRETLAKRKEIIERKAAQMRGNRRQDVADKYRRTNMTLARGR